MTSIWAHRGASLAAPENTLAAFELARDLGAEGVELDVQLSWDGQVVCIHDETLDRTTSGSGPVAARSLEDLRALDASNGMSDYAGEKIPTLAEVFDLLGPTDMTINVELKNSAVAYPGLEEKVLQAIAEADMVERVLLSTFNHVSLRALVEQRLPVRTGMLFIDVMWEPWHYASELGVDAIHPYHRYLAASPGTTAACHQIDVAVNTWTVDDPEHIAEMLADEVDAIITNDPAEALRVRDLR